MKIAIIQFPGSNCERETRLALSRCGMNGEDFLWNHESSRLNNYQGFVIVGGFSYEDRIRSGVIAAMDPIMQALHKQAHLGKPILGICNGAQILVESGLVPGLNDSEKTIALAQNRRLVNNEVLGTGFYNDWVYIKANDNTHAFNSHINSTDTFHIPAAHAEGRFILEEELYQKLKASNAAMFFYCDSEGNVNQEFPYNPNGSFRNLAAIGNAHGNVMAMMPHPERTENGDKIFLSMKQFIEQGFTEINTSLDYQAPQLDIQSHDSEDDALTLTIGLNIHDNEAITLENALQLAGFTLKVKKYTQWHIQHRSNDSKSLLNAIQSSLELYNPSKEYINTSKPSLNSKTILVYERDDSVAQKKLHNLKHHFNIDCIDQLHRAKCWVFEHNDNNQLEKEITLLLERKILANPLSHYCVVSN